MTSKASITKKRKKSKIMKRHKSSNKTLKRNTTTRKIQGNNRLKKNKYSHMDVDNKKETNSLNTNLILSNLEKKKKGTLKNINYQYFNQKYYYQ